MNKKTLFLYEMNRAELEQTKGGTFNYFAYAMGYVTGRAIAMVKGAYTTGYDSGKNECECQ